MYKTKLWMLCPLLLLLYLPARAQKTVKGSVFDLQTKEPVTGALITDKNKTIGTVTDVNGRFSLETSEALLYVTSVGYEELEFAVGDQVKLSMKPVIQNLQSIVVTANREAMLRTAAPIAISKVSSKMIDEAKPTSAYEIINKAPGVLMVNLNNEQHAMAIRQPMTTNAYFLYLEDGIPIRPLGVFNHNAVLEMNQFTVSSIEVVKGPVSSIYGAEAVGGAINFISQRPTAIPTARIGVQVDQWGYQRLQYGGGAIIGKLGFYAGGLVSRQRDSWITSSDYDKHAQYARLEYNINRRARLTGTFSYSDYNSQTSGSVDSISFYSRQYISATDFTYRKAHSLRTRLTFDYEWNKKAQTSFTLFARGNKHGQNPAYAIRWIPGTTTARGEINSNNFQSTGLIVQHHQKLNFLNSKFIAGGVLDLSPNQYWSYQIDLAAQLRADKKSVEKYSIVNERPDLQLANYDADIKNTAAYVQYDFKPISKLLVSVGGRYDRMGLSYFNALDATRGTKNYSSFSPKVGLTYELLSNVGIYANYSRGFSPPALTSIFRKRPVPAEDGTLFYYNLEPAIFHNKEIGGWASLFKNKLYLDLAVYAMTGTNELLNIRQPDNSFDYQSAGKTLHKGIEMGLSFKPGSQMFFRFGGTHAIHRFINFTLSTRASDALLNVDGLDMPSSPKWVWNSEITYYPKWFNDLHISMEVQRVSSWYQNQTNTISYKGYTVFNSRIGYAWKKLEIYTNILNLTDILYAYNASRGNTSIDRTTYNPAAPRTFIMGLQYTLSNENVHRQK